jgi:hypothetical protein
MKIWTSKYRNHWVSPYVILTRICFWEKDQDRIYNLNDDPANPYEPWVKALEPVCKVWQRLLDLVHPRIEYVKLDRWDTWSFDHTMAEIILPGLKQLREDKNGAPYTDDEDVPEYLRSHMAQPKENEWDTDSLHFMRWDWILDEMIWAFEQKVDDESDSKFFDHSECPADPTARLEDLTNGASRVKYDEAGHRVWHERKANGFRLFGRYYENLWS